ncbi:MAG: hypothetical protein K2M17_02320 [Bacilli bacterium]|nr:hypothetical protein [Bacilli bacterium]
MRDLDTLAKSDSNLMLKTSTNWKCWRCGNAPNGNSDIHPEDTIRERCLFEFKFKKYTPQEIDLVFYSDQNLSLDSLYCLYFFMYSSYLTEEELAQRNYVYTVFEIRKQRTGTTKIAALRTYYDESVQVYQNFSDAVKVTYTFNLKNRERCTIPPFKNTSEEPVYFWWCPHYGYWMKNNNDWVLKGPYTAKLYFKSMTFKFKI